MTPQRESGDRARFLGRLRERLGRRPAHPHGRPVLRLEGEPPPVAYATPMDDLTMAFCQAAAQLGALVRRTGRDGLPEVLDEALALAGPGPVALTEEPETAGLEGLLKTRGREVIRPSQGPRAVAGACLGITGAVAGLARTGTLVVDSSRAGSRTVSLLPPVHLALLPATALLPDHGALLRSLDAAALPASLVLITGPSRSSDIELELTLGVHGPGRLLVALLV